MAQLRTMNTLPKSILLFCVIMASASAGTLREAPKGMYIYPSGFLSATNQAVTSAGSAISNANCDGVRWLLRWSAVEASPDTYTWQYLDDAVAWAAANNKKCGISINAGRDCPAWLYAAPYNAQSYTMQDTPGAIGRTIPLPGDPVFMSRWQKFITDFGARYDSNPAVSYVIVAGIGNHDEWDIAPGTLDTAALGSTQAEVNTWKSSSKQIIDFYMSAFPSTTVMGYPVPPFDPSNAAENPLTSMREVSDYAANTYYCHFGYAVAPLQSSTTTSNYPPANEVLLHWTTNPTHGETLNPAISADDFDATLHVALDLKIRGMEIYKKDFENAALQNFIVSSRAYASQVGGITPRRADMLAIPAPTPCPVAADTPTPTPTPPLTPTPTPSPSATPALSGLTYNGGIAFVNGINLVAGTSYTIAAQANASTKSVVFTRDSAVVKIDSAIPFDFAWAPTSTGTHTFVATPWSSTGGAGNSGASITVGFNVVKASLTPTPTPTPTPTATPTSTLTISISASPASVGKGGTATFTVSASTSNPSQSKVINYLMSGTAVLGTDYTLSGTPGKITISAGASSAVVTLQVITSKTKGSETATMNLQAGSGYTVNQKAKNASVKIVN